MSQEQWPKSDFSKFLEAKEAEGWFFVGRESLTETRFSKEAKFEQVPVQSKEDIRNKYLERAKIEDPESDYEIDLVLDTQTDQIQRIKQIVSEEEFQNLEENLADRYKTYLVFARRK